MADQKGMIDLEKQNQERLFGDNKEAEIDRKLKSEGVDKLLEGFRDNAEGAVSPSQIGYALERQLQAEKEAKAKAKDKAEEKAFMASLNEPVKIRDGFSWKGYRQELLNRVQSIHIRLDGIKGRDKRVDEIREMADAGFVTDGERETAKLEKIMSYHRLLGK